MARQNLKPTLDNMVVIDVNKTLGALTFKKFEKSMMVYEDGKPTGEVRGYKFKVESQNLMDVIEVVVEDTKMDVFPFDDEPQKYYNKPVNFTNLTLKPYVDTNSNFPRLAWSIKADGIKFVE